MSCFTSIFYICLWGPYRPQITKPLEVLFVYMRGTQSARPAISLSVNVPRYLNKMVASKRLMGVIGRVTRPPRCDLRYCTD